MNGGTFCRERKVGDIRVSVRRLESRDQQHWFDLFKQYIAFYQADVPEET